MRMAKTEKKGEETVFPHPFGMIGRKKKRENKNKDFGRKKGRRRGGERRKRCGVGEEKGDKISG